MWRGKGRKHRRVIHFPKTRFRQDTEIAGYTFFRFKTLLGFFKYVARGAMAVVYLS